jgi:hypothetical protein
VLLPGNSATSGYPRVVPGLSIGGDVEIPLGDVMAVRPRAAFDLLGPLSGTAPTPGVRAGLDLAVRIGGPG